MALYKPEISEPKKAPNLLSELMREQGKQEYYCEWCLRDILTLHHCIKGGKVYHYPRRIGNKVVCHVCYHYQNMRRKWANIPPSREPLERQIARDMGKWKVIVQNAPGLPRR